MSKVSGRRFIKATWARRLKCAVSVKCITVFSVSKMVATLRQLLLLALVATTFTFRPSTGLEVSTSQHSRTLQSSPPENGTEVPQYPLASSNSENSANLDPNSGGRNGRTFFGDIGGFLRPSIFNIVRFPNEECLDASNQSGTCYTALECKKLGGNPSSKCARGLGTCCISKCFDVSVFVFG